MNIFQRLVYAAFFARYDATQYSQFRSYRSTPLQDARLDLTKASREVLQAKSRDFERNSPLYTKLADTWEQYVVGAGIQFTSASQDATWNITADSVFERWKPLADLQSRFGFDNLQGVIARSLFVDGEVFVLLTREGAYPRIQLIEAHRCETPDQLRSQEGKGIVDGVELDANGRPIAYWFETNEVYRREDAANVVHIYEPSRPGLYRGIPYCTAALNVLHDLEDLRALEMRASKDAAELSTIYKTSTGELPPSLVSMAEKFRTASTASGTSSIISETKREYYQNSVGGRNIVLQNGDEAIQHVPERPGANTREYWRLLAGDVCACAGIPLSIVYPDSMQGTVYRGSVDAFAAFCRAKTAVLSTYFRRIREYVIQIEATYNRGIAKLPDDWRKVSSGTVRAPNVDIGRNSNAMIAELKAGLRSWDSIAAELGESADMILTQKAATVDKINKIAASLKISPRDVTDIIEATEVASVVQSESVSPIDQAKIEMDAYGVGVRAGAITPNKEDENYFRQRLNLPAAPSVVDKAWETDEGTRRPITLTPPPGSDAAAVVPMQTGATPEEQQL